MNFTTKIRNITLKTLTELEEANAKIAELEREKQNYYKPAFAELMDKATARREEAISSGRNQVSAEIDLFKCEVRKRYTPNGEDLHADAALLTTPGVEINREDMEALLDKHAGNITMQKLLFKYAEAQKLNIGRVFVSEKQMCEAADSMKQYFENAMSRPGYAEVFRNDAWFNKACPDILRGGWA